MSPARPPPTPPRLGSLWVRCGLKGRGRPSGELGRGAGPGPAMLRGKARRSGEWAGPARWGGLGPSSPACGGGFCAPGRGAGQGAVGKPPRLPSARPGAGYGAASCSRSRRKGRAPWKGGLPLPPGSPSSHVPAVWVLICLKGSVLPLPRRDQKSRGLRSVWRGRERPVLPAPTPGGAGAPLWACLGGGEGGLHRSTPSRSPLNAEVVSLAPAVI